MSTSTAPVLLNADQAAEYLTVSRKSIDTMTKLGHLKPINVSTNPKSRKKTLRYRVSDLEAFLRERTAKPTIKAA